MSNDRRTILELANRYQLSMILHLVIDLEVGPKLITGQSLDAIARAHGIKFEALLSATQTLSAVAGIFDPSGRHLTPVGRVLLDPSSPRCIAPMVDHEIRQQGLWHDLDTVLRSDEPLAGQQDVEMAVDEERLVVLLRAMRAMNPELVEDVGAMTAWTSRSMVLDVAGGHGAFLVEILRRDADKRGGVVDQATARKECLATFDAAGVQDRASFDACDLKQQDPLAGWVADAVLLCRCLHNFSPSGINNILGSVRAVLLRAGGGVCVVVERRLDRDGRRLVPRKSALFSGYMAVNCAGGHVPRTEWMMRALSRIGTVDQVPLGELHSAFLCEVQ